MRPTSDHESRQRRPDEGIAVIWVAVFLLVSLWFVSLAIDMGKLMAAKTELQAAADAAALAGASAIDPETGAVVQDSATVRSTMIGGANSAYEGTETPIVVDPGDISFPAANQVRVIVRREAATGNPVLTHFAQTLGIPNLSVNADATAEAQLIGKPCEHLSPFAPPEPPSGDFSKDCDSTYAFKVGAGTGTAGNFQLLDFGECNEDDFTGGGAAAIRQYIKYGYDCCLEIGQIMEVPTQPGNMVGPVREGFQYRWDEDSDHSTHCYQDYTGNGSRVFVVPIIKSFTVNGKKIVQITRFAAFFLRDRPTGNLATKPIVGQFINYIVPGEAGPTPPADSGIYGIHLVE
jgi:hypothetical protein